MSAKERLRIIGSVLKNAVYYYKMCAIIFFNTLVLFVLLNGALFILFKIKDSFETTQNIIFKQYGSARVMKAYPEYTESDVDALLKETWEKHFEFEPFTQFKERVAVGKWVNVDSNGFRHTKDQGPWPPDRGNLNLFLFGGSTTYGYGVPDNQTVASHLQDYLRGHCKKEVKVYNFGRGFYYSTQERVLFDQLLLGAFLPDVAVFIDGINDCFHLADKPLFTPKLADFMDNGAPGMQVQASKLPVARLARFMASASGVILSPPDEPPEDEKLIAGVIKRYSRNQLLIEATGRACGVTPVFVWQPAPTYKYDLKHHLFMLDYKELGQSAYSRYGYPRLAKMVKEKPEDFSPNFLWLADIQEESTEPLYVDWCHYSPKFSKTVAAHIGRFLVDRKMLGGAAGKQG